MKLVLVLGLSVCMLPLLAAAEVVVPIDSVENFVNIRLSPDAKSEIVGRLQQGESTPIVRSIPEWHEVEIAGDATGFISADWTNVLDHAPAPVAEVVSGEFIADEEEPAGDLAADVEELEFAEEAIVEVGIVSETEAVAGTDSEAVEPVEEAIGETTDVDEPVAGETIVPVVVGAAGEAGPQGPPGIMGPPGPQGLPGAATIEGSKNFLMKFTSATIGGNSLVFDDGNYIGIGTTDPKQRLEVNGNIQIHERTGHVAGLIMTQSSGESGYIMHNRASTLTIGAGSVDRITIDRDGNVGFGTSRPLYPIEMASGAYVSAGGVWTDSSSREKKENIVDLTPEEALAALANLEPVTFNYKQDIKEQYVGFIAEDVPQLVASADRTGLSAMDIVAVLTRVVQLQQQQIAELESRLERRD